MVDPGPGARRRVAAVPRRADASTLDPQPSAHDGGARDAAVRARLLSWYRAHRRDLPWRRTSDAYAVWISEVMLQQTRVDTVLPYYERFLERWPTVQALAAADPAEVQAAWSGLGYYRRARLMLSAAESIVRDHGGRLPRQLADLRALPGFGRYTAGAVASIAYGEPVAAVDGNVTRVLARLFGIAGDVTAGPGAAEIWRRAEALAPGEAPGELNQALIELGALVCAPRSPRCSECPVSSGCVALAGDRVAELPSPKKRPAKSELELTALCLLDRAERAVLLERQPAGGLFAELWCLPALEGLLEEDEVREEAGRRCGIEVDRVERPHAQLAHVLTHRRIELRVFRVYGALAAHTTHPSSAVAEERPASQAPDGGGTSGEEARVLEWVELAELDRRAIPSLTAKALRGVLPRHLRARVVLLGRTTKAQRTAQKPGPFAT